jgi:hypothetical protein
MATRGSKLSYRHVEALNAIQVEFLGGTKEKRVVDAWKIYLDHLNTPMPEPPTDLAPWGLRAEELLTDLLYEMSQCLGYDFDKVTIKRNVYTPRGHGELELDQHVLRKALVDILIGRKALPIAITADSTSPSPSGEAQPQNQPPQLGSGQSD